MKQLPLGVRLSDRARLASYVAGVNAEAVAALRALLVPGGSGLLWLWGPRGYDGSLIIHVGGDPERWRRGCGSIEIVDKTDSPFAMPYENGRPVFICRNSRLSLEKLWDRLKRYR